MIEIQIDEAFLAKIEQQLLIQSAQAVLNHHRRDPHTGVTIVIGDNTQVQSLNLEFMKVDSPTDVLSFPAGFDDPESGHPYLGDIVIAYPQAETQAQSAGHPVSEELQLLVIHGALHLLGYDHATPAEKTAMWAVQEDLLTSLGIRARPHD